MDRKERTVVMDERRASASDTANTKKAFWLENMGSPSLSLFPPGTVIAAANATVAMRDAATVHDVAMPVIHWVSCAASSRWCSLKMESGVLPSAFLDFLSCGRTN